MKTAPKPIIDRIFSSSTDVLLVFLSFWVTVLAVRGIIFWSVRRGTIPAIFINGWHVHHFITGFVLLIIALVLYYKKIWSHHIPLVLLGCGLALVFDECLFWTRGHFNYWSMINLFAVALTGLLLAGSYQYSRQSQLLHPLPIRSEVKQWSIVLLPVVLASLLLLNWFSFHNLTAASAANRLIPRVLRVARPAQQFAPNTQASGNYPR